MNNRLFISDSESWRTYVGAVTVTDFIIKYGDPAYLDYDGISRAVNNYLDNHCPNNKPYPHWLRQSLIDYLDDWHFD